MNLERREKIKQAIMDCFRETFSGSLGLERLRTRSKADQSPVTAIDEFISTLVKTHQIDMGDGFFFLCEEEKHSIIDQRVPFPALILDPIDGTRELAQGIGECAFSLAMMESGALAPRSSFGWILNPFTGFEMHSHMPWTPSQNMFPGKRYGLVSRTEWDAGLFRQMDTSLVQLSPRGSIAFKLGLLASGACDFVVTRRPKNVWDIAAGTILCRQRGIRLFCEGRPLESLDVLRYEAPMVWCKSETDYAVIVRALAL